MVTPQQGRLRTVWRELQRRKVSRVALVYILMAWGVMQVGELLFEALQVPPGAYTLLVILILLGFPIAVVLAWAYEITPEGVRRDKVRELQCNGAVGSSVEERVLKNCPQDSNCIAILPFKDMTPEQDLTYFCDGLAEEIQNALCDISNLEVVARAHSVQFGGKKIDITEIAQKLCVRAVLEGSVRRSDGEYRISVQLVSAASGTDIWSRSFERSRDNEFEIQKNIAGEIAESTRLTFCCRSHIYCAHCSPVTYDYFRRGMQYFRRRSAKDTAYAREMFEKAIHQENDYGPAWAGLAYTYGFECLSFNRTQAVRRRARRFSTKALQLSPGLSTSYVAKGIVNLLDSRASAAHEAFEIATAIEPQNFEAWYFNACNWARAGDPAKAISLFEKASGCDEQDFQSVLMQSQLYQSLGDTGGSMKALQHGLEVARTSLERRPDNYRALNLGAIALLQLGMREEGLEWMERSLANAPRDAIMEYNAACFFSVSGDIARSLKHLDRCRLMGRIDEDWLNHDSNLDAVKESPEFKRRIMAAPVAANLPVVTQPGAVGADTLHTIR